MKKFNWVLRLFLVLFSVSVSFTILPCEVVYARGLFGEITAIVVVQDVEQETTENRNVQQEKVHKAKGLNIFNPWFERLIAVEIIVFDEQVRKLPREDTIVALSVRMDN